MDEGTEAIRTWLADEDGGEWARQCHYLLARIDELERDVRKWRRRQAKMYDECNAEATRAAELEARIDELAAGHLQRTKICFEHITALEKAEARIDELAKSRTCRECGAACGHADTCSVVTAQVKTAWLVERLRAVADHVAGLAEDECPLCAATYVDDVLTAHHEGCSMAALEPGDLGGER